MKRGMGSWIKGLNVQSSDSLTGRRRDACYRFASVGFPSNRDEAWKYTDLSDIADGKFILSNYNSNSTSNSNSSFALNIDAYRMVFVDGILCSDISIDKGRVESLSSRLALGDALETLGSLVPASATPFAALNLAAVCDGVVIELDAFCLLEKPIYLLFLSCARKPVMSHPRIRISIGTRSKLTVLEHYVGETGALNLTNVVTEVWLDEGAHLTHYKLQEAAQSEYHIANMKADQRCDSHFASYSFNFGSALTRNDINVELNGENCNTELWGLFYGQGRQHIDNHTVINHNVQRTFSYENYKGMLDEQARAVFNGRIYIKRNAQQVRGYQNNANLLLSDRAKINIKPELEIYSDDVRCSHGASTGQLNQNALFAMRSRGLDEHTARAMLTLAFAGEVIESTCFPTLEERVKRTVVGKLLPDLPSLC